MSKTSVGGKGGYATIQERMGQIEYMREVAKEVEDNKKKEKMYGEILKIADKYNDKGLRKIYEEKLEYVYAINDDLLFTQNVLTSAEPD